VNLTDLTRIANRPKKLHTEYLGDKEFADTFEPGMIKRMLGVIKIQDNALQEIKEFGCFWDHNELADSALQLAGKTMDDKL